MADKLTGQRKHFCVLMAEGKLTARECAIEAGYSPKSADQQASMLMKKPEIAEEIHRIEAKAVAACMGSKAEALNHIWEIAVAAKAGGKPMAALRGFETWLKGSGNWVEKLEADVAAKVIEIDWSASGDGS